MRSRLGRGGEENLENEEELGPCIVGALAIQRRVELGVVKEVVVDLDVQVDSPNMNRKEVKSHS